MSQVPQIDAGEARSHIDAGAFLLDVREDDEWDAGHCPTATHIALSELMARAGDVPDAGEVIVVCRVGGRSMQAVRWLRAQGVDAYNLNGGMRAVAASGLDIVDDAGDAGKVI